MVGAGRADIVGRHLQLTNGKLNKKQPSWASFEKDVTLQLGSVRLLASPVRVYPARHFEEEHSVTAGSV